MLKFLETKSETLSPDAFVDKFNGKRVLVIGSGPSLNSVNWKNLEYDVIVTTTFFYLNDEIRNLKNIKHVTLSELVDLNDPLLVNFIENNPACTLALEPVMGRPFYQSDEFKKFELKHRNSLIYYNTEINGKEGAAGRLCLFVMAFNPSELYYVGLDGRSKNVNNDPYNAFRTNLKDGDNGTHSYDVIYKSHIQLAKTLHEYSKLNGCKLYNLGEGFDFNCSSDYSKINFPLTDEIQNTIKKEK